MKSGQNQFKKIPVGISTCLLGEKVRFDGGHKEDRYLTRVLSEYFQWVPVCPEVEMGLPIPRENLRLVKVDDEIRLIGGKTGQDFTEQMFAWAKQRLTQLQAAGLCGYIVKRSSPSCGMERVRVYGKSGIPERNGVGLYTDLLLKTYPLLPVEEEGRLNDPVLLENFIERVFAYHRLQQFLQAKPGVRDLMQFHTRHKLTLMAHSPTNAIRLGRIVARTRPDNFDEMLEEYITLFMHTLRRKATPQKHANVMYHIMGYFKKQLDTNDKQECVEAIENYRTGYLPLVVPLTLLKHHLRRHPVDWLTQQVYFNPYPAELMLRNKI
ncbi:MAG: DUF1722 domain-containing protein [Calditrichaeota bacterium]|nr:MAG: DUF1722 domain-containing protein [Calditrichota bacterium]